MAVKLVALPLMKGQAMPFGDLIPFSDYSRWERRPVKNPEAQPPKIRSKGLREGPLQWTRQRMPAPGIQLQLNSVEIEKVSNHTSMLKQKLSSRPQEPDGIKILQSEVIAKRNSLEVYEAYVKDLLAENVALIGSIMDMEDKTNSTVDKVLGRYKHFKGAMNTLKLKSVEMLEEAKQELEETRSALYQNTEAQHGKIRLVDEAINSSSKRLLTLKHYKDKEYPVRQVRIEQLRENQEDINFAQEEEVREINLQVAEEEEHYEHHMRAMKIELQNRATEVCLASAQRQCHAQALHNKVMEKEIMLHQKHRRELTEAITELKIAVSCMRQEGGRPPLRRHTKCFPDTEIILNIPTQERVPV